MKKKLKKKLISVKKYFIYNLNNNPIDVMVIIISILFLIYEDVIIMIMEVCNNRIVWKKNRY